MTTLEMLQERKIQNLEYELRMYRDHAMKPNYAGRDIVDLDLNYLPLTLYVPLYGFAKTIETDLELTVRVSTHTESALYITQKTAQLREYDKAQLFDCMLEKLKEKYVSNLLYSARCNNYSIDNQTQI
jgi:hypothetical protein